MGPAGGPGALAAAGLMAAAPFASHHRVRSRRPDVLRDAVADLAVGHDVIPRGSFLDGVVNGTAVGSVNLVFVRYGGPVVVEAPATGSRVAVTVPLGPMDVTGHEQRTVAGEGFVLADDRPTVMRPDPYAGAVVIAADRALLDRALTRLSGARHGTVEFGPRWPRPVVSPSLIDATWRHVGDVLAANPSAPPVAVKALESMLVDAILLGVPHSHSAVLAAPRAEAPGHAERIRLWLAEHHAEPVTMAELASAVGLSVRQVQQVVRAAYGTTPSLLLREIRLERSRALLRSGAAPSVSRAATEAGFGHLGRFAAAYRERYGELPSATRA